MPVHFIHLLIYNIVRQIFLFRKPRTQWTTIVRLLNMGRESQLIYEGYLRCHFNHAWQGPVSKDTEGTGTE